MTKNLPNLTMPPYCSTLIGVLHGVSDYFKIEVSTPWLFGGSGFAFLMNVHEEICPSGPYCWDMRETIRRIENLGIVMSVHGSYTMNNSLEERQQLDALLIEKLDQGIPCSLSNMEHQLITGYDDTGFLTAQPWAPQVTDFPPAHLTFGSWEEIKDECHVEFFSFAKATPAKELTVIRDSLKLAVDFHRNPQKYSHAPYATGSGAYANWIKGVESGHGSEHGNWWNGMVWTESRKLAVKYFQEIGTKYPLFAAVTEPFIADYTQIAEALYQVSDKSISSEKKIELLKEAQQIEAAAINRIEQLLPMMG